MKVGEVGHGRSHQLSQQKEHLAEKSTRWDSSQVPYNPHHQWHSQKAKHILNPDMFMKGSGILQLRQHSGLAAQNWPPRGCSDLSWHPRLQHPPPAPGDSCIWEKLWSLPVDQDKAPLEMQKCISCKCLWTEQTSWGLSTADWSFGETLQAQSRAGLLNTDCCPHGNELNIQAEILQGAYHKGKLVSSTSITQLQAKGFKNAKNQYN